jgi:pimeloyl-ACP methyl ester carboxylesterase
LRQRLKGQVRKLVLLDWIVSEAPQSFLDALESLQSPDRWQETVAQLTHAWLRNVDHPRLSRFVNEEIGSYGFEMWARAARMISTAYTFSGSPLDELASLEPSVPVLHLCSQPEDAQSLDAQQSFAAANPWFQVQKLQAKSHFPMFEVPGEMADAIEKFASSP